MVMLSYFWYARYDGLDCTSGLEQAAIEIVSHTIVGLSTEMEPSIGMSHSRSSGQLAIRRRVGL